MPRFRRRRSRRRQGNYVWQTYANAKLLEFEAPTAKDDLHSGELFATSLKPGLGDPLIVADEQDVYHTPFTNDHTLERIRGSMCHNGGQYTATTSVSWFPMSIVAVKVPRGLSIDDEEDYPNLFDNGKIGNMDIIYRHDVVCDASSNNASPNWHDVDSKAKRKFEVGDIVKFLYTLRQPFASTVNDWQIEVAVNLRFLWRLTN